MRVCLKTFPPYELRDRKRFQWFFMVYTKGYFLPTSYSYYAPFLPLVYGLVARDKIRLTFCLIMVWMRCDL
ncbi:hypothetical protein ABKN59_009054 [Abortiporus biennis]